MQWHVTRQRGYLRLVAQEPEVAGFEFRIGDAFPADDPMARYVVRLSMAFGDLRIAGAEYAARERAGPGAWVPRSETVTPVLSWSDPRDSE
jgi:hypothetical protein